MKVILKREVDNLGLAGDVVDVADGYGRNFLIPRGMAILATDGAMKEAEALTRSRKAKEAQTVDQARDYKQALENRTLRIEARVDERGHLYGSVGVVDIHRVLKERGHTVERKRIDLKGAIKELGTYEVDVHVHPQVTATVEVEVVDEEGKVVAGQKAPPPPPLPGEEPAPQEAAAADEPAAAEAADAADEASAESIVEEALAAAEILEQAVEEQREDDADAADDDAADAEEPAEA